MKLKPKYSKMENGYTFFITLGIIVLLASIPYYFIFKSERKDKELIDSQWKNFLRAVDKNNISEIISYGDKLIWNKYLKRDQLSKIIEVVKLRIDNYPELEKLKLDAFNKKLDYDRILPSPGSSGGIKQSW